MRMPGLADLRQPISRGFLHTATSGGAPGFFFTRAAQGSFKEELTAIGKQRWPSLTKAQQFARAYECNGALAKRATRRPSPSTSFPFPTEKAMSLEPRVTSGGMESFLDVDADAPAAYAELMKLVEQQRREGESEAAAFERVFLDPANKTLALRALGQRVPTESSPPRQS